VSRKLPAALESFALRATAPLEVTLERHADHCGHGILQLLREVGRLIAFLSRSACCHQRARYYADEEGLFE